MVSIRQDFINRYKNVQESIIKAMDKALERAIGNKVIDFEKCEDNYLDVYPLIGAVLQKEMKRIADNIFGYNPKIDPRDPLFRKTLSWSVKKEGKGKKNEKND